MQIVQGNPTIKPGKLQIVQGNQTPNRSISFIFGIVYYKTRLTLKILYKLPKTNQHNNNIDTNYQAWLLYLYSGN